MLHRPQNQKQTLTYFAFPPQILLKPGFGHNHPTQGVVQYSHRSACVLPTEARGLHKTQTRTQGSPAVAETDARLAVGFLVLDNSGPVTAEGEFAASVMRQLRRPISLGYFHGRCRSKRPRRNRAGLLLYPRT